MVLGLVKRATFVRSAYDTRRLHAGPAGYSRTCGNTPDLPVTRRPSRAPVIGGSFGPPMSAPADLSKLRIDRGAPPAPVRRALGRNIGLFVIAAALVAV